MIQKLLTHSIKTNKLLVTLQFVCTMLSFFLICWGYSDIYEHFCENQGRTITMEDIRYVISCLFGYDINITLILIGIWVLLINGYLFFVHSRKQMFSVLYMCGASKRKLGIYFMIETGGLHIFSSIISNVIYLLLLIIMGNEIQFFACVIVFEGLVIILIEFILGVIYVKNNFRLL